MDGRDITEDLRSKLDEVPPRHKPRFYMFRVEYKDKRRNTVDNEPTGTGEIMLILPRHPEEGMFNLLPLDQSGNFHLLFLYVCKRRLREQ